MNSNSLKASSLAVLLLLACPITNLFAQDAAVLRQNAVELGGFVGANYGLDSPRIMGGGNVTYSALKNVLLYGEISYFSEIPGTFTNVNRTIEHLSNPLTDLNFGVHLRVRVPRTPIVPYLVAGIGLLHASEHSKIVQKINPLTMMYETTKGTVLASTDLAFDYGAGIRWYIREQFGMRGEFKGYRLTGGPYYDSGAHNLFRATVGFFVQF